MRVLQILTTALVVLLATVVPSQAQIYSWRDASGTLVLSDKPRRDGSAEMTTYEVRSSSRLVTRTPDDVAPTTGGERGPAAPKAVGEGGYRTTMRPTGANASRFDALIEQHASSLGVSADLVRAVIQAESGFNPNAISRKGAMGLMQLMPATARELGVDNPFHPGENIRGGVTYLARLLARYDQNVELALAAYNAGPASVERYGNAVPPYRETRDYVRKITSKPGTTHARPPDPVIYKWTEVVDGQPKVRYSNVAPNGITYETVGRR